MISAYNERLVRVEDNGKLARCVGFMDITCPYDAEINEGTTLSAVSQKDKNTSIFLSLTCYFCTQRNRPKTTTNPRVDAQSKVLCRLRSTCLELDIGIR